jgi:thiamine-phosphate pyrophosphorylase
VIRYAITDGTRFGTDAASRLAGLCADAERWAALGLDFVQLREKSLDAGELFRLAEAMAAAFHAAGGKTKLLVNGRADVALAAGADGVHLTSRSDELTPAQVRWLYAQAGLDAPVVSVSCHSVEEAARASGVDLILFGPVFEKRVAGAVVVQGAGLEALRTACRAAGSTPVLALGGVDAENAAACVEAGASGVAGIRLFAENS